MNHLFLGAFVHCKSFDDLEIVENGFIAVRNGKIIAAGSRENVPSEYVTSLPITELSRTQFLLPGFIDCHIHAPQYPNLGLGLDMPLLQWLQTYTFPVESTYNIDSFARHVYNRVVHRTLSCGTTLAAYFATNHKSSSLILAEEAAAQGQRALIGKVCSDSSSPDYYIEKTDESLRDTEQFITAILGLNNALVKPIVTPRFALSCSTELLSGLAKLAAKYDLHIQSHISENVDEVAAVESIFKKSYASVYNDTKLLTPKCVMAHGVHLSDAELRIFSETQAAIAHCPTSNTKLRSGFCDVRRLLGANVKVGLGTDVSGGHSASMLMAIQDALNVSHSLNFVKKQKIVGTGQIAEADEPQNKHYEPLEYKHALYLATLGGSEALAMSDVCGNFMVGKDFDALLVDASVVPIDFFDIPKTPVTEATKTQSHVEKILQKFLYSGDDRNIVKVFIAGKQVKQ